jgi:hypothetical protein
MLFDQMLKDKSEGFFAWPEPACSGSNAGKVRKALPGQWLVNVNS